MKATTCVVSCDSSYLKSYFPSFAMSCNLAGNPIHCHLINPDDEDLDFASDIAGKLTDVNVGLTFERGSPDSRVYYACNRFLIAPALLQKYNSMMICDIDSIVVKTIPEFPEDVGLYFRDPLPGVNQWETEGSRVAAGAVYLNANSYPFAQEVSSLLQAQDGDLRWFADQFSLYRVYIKHKNSLTFRDLSQGFMSWETSDGCYLFSAKGDRKFTHDEYVRMKARYEELVK